MVYLITGACGTGKTWVMQQLIEKYHLHIKNAKGLYAWVENWKEEKNIAALGKYGGGEEFEGGDRLSMAVMSSNAEVKPIFAKFDAIVAEGDRFTNSTFIEEFKPLIIRIRGDGVEGRKIRGTNQTTRHLKSIASRVANIIPDVYVNNSEEAYQLMVKEIEHPTFKSPEHRPGAQNQLF